MDFTWNGVYSLLFLRAFFGGMVAAYLCMAEVMGGILAMAAYHEKLERMYYKKEGAD